MKVLKYQLCTEVNHGTEDEPKIEQVFSAVSLGWSAANEAIAKAEAYNGEYTIEDDGEMEPAPTQIDRIEAQVAYTAMMTETLLESELFGYEKGAFTDARKDKAGRMETASGGTLFLDEIGNLSLPMQARLLTAIEKRQITRLGSTQPKNIDIRLICATNADIHNMVTTGKFRQDLLYRINTIEIPIPPLRERGKDILLLARHFLNRYCYKYKKEITGFTRDTQQKLLQYNWPGNVRELQHAVERAVILAPGKLLEPDNFMLRPPYSSTTGDLETLNLMELEQKAIEKAMKKCEGNISRAAEMLGITRFALYRKLEKYEI